MDYRDYREVSTKIGPNAN